MPRILHLGVGNFHRAHQAAYTAAADGDWRITGVVMGNVSLYDVMSNGQGYSLGVRGAKGMTTQHITVHDRMILARNAPQAVIDAFVDPDLHIVTLTITEKGYCLDAATGELDLANPAIAADLVDNPTSAMGLLTHGLARRAQAGLSPLTVICCDNLSGNGGKLQRAVSSFAHASSLALDEKTCFPDTMVDRITPASPDVSGPVITEKFSEWVIEENFAGPRPDWEAAGAEFTADVAPFEMRKLRLLNAAHSWLAYAGQMSGHTYVHEAMSDPDLRKAVESLWDEAQGTLPDAVRSSTPAYRAALIDRFSVSEMRHALAQIGADGSLKLRERIAPLIMENANAEQATNAVAVWIAFVLRKANANIDLIDPNAEGIAQIISDAADLNETCEKLTDLIGIVAPPKDWVTSLPNLVRGYLGRV